MTQAKKHLPVVQADERYEANYAARKAIADAQRAELDAAIAACGPGADVYGRHRIHDKLGEAARVIYCCRRDGGVWTPPAPPCDDVIFAESVLVTTPSGVKYTTRAVTIPEGPFAEHAVTRLPRRYEVSTVALTAEYRPRTPEQMKAAAEARRTKAIAELEAEAAEERARAAAAPQLQLFSKDHR
jgi:hypothetical protein